MTADPLLQEHRTAEDSDLDLLVTCPAGISLLDLIGLQQDVEDLTDVHATIAYIPSSGTATRSTRTWPRSKRRPSRTSG